MFLRRQDTRNVSSTSCDCCSSSRMKSGCSGAVRCSVASISVNGLSCVRGGRRLAQATYTHPEIMSPLEGRSAGSKPDVDGYAEVLEKYTPAYLDDPELARFVRSGAQLSPVINRLINFEPAEPS